MFAMVPGTPAKESTWGVRWRCAGIRRPSANAEADAKRQIAAAAGQSASGSAWRMKPPAAGPINQPSCQEKLENAM